MKDDWTKRHRETLDALMVKHFGAAAFDTQTATVGCRQAGKTFTMEKLEEAMKLVADIPPPPFFASSRFLPADGALRFKWGNREYVGAHPDFWEKVMRQLPVVRQAAGFMDLTVVDIDDDAGEADRKAFFKAMTLAMGGVWP